MIYDLLENALPSVFSFTATTPGAIELPVAGAPMNGEPLLNVDGDSWFAKGDNVLLQSIRASIPFGFGQGSGAWVFNLEWVDSGNVVYPISELAEGAGIFLPNGCDPLTFPGNGLFLKIPDASPSKLQLRIGLSLFNVSMVNLPDILDGVVVGVMYNIAVQHTKPLAGVP